MSETFEWIEQNGSAVAAWNGGTCRVSGTEWEFCEDNKPRTSGVGLNYENAKTRCEELWKHRGTNLPKWAKNGAVNIPEHDCTTGIPDVPVAKNILEEASDVVKQRMTMYGHPTINHKATATMWQAWEEVKRMTDCGNIYDAPVFNIMQKLCRHAFMPTRDNLVDIAGYTLTIEMIDESRAARQNGQNGPWIDTGKYGDPQ